MAQDSILRTIVAGTVLTSAFSIVVKLVGIATIFLILSRFSVAEYGVLELALSLVALLSIFTLPGLDSLVAADMSIEKGKGELTHARNILSSFFLLQVLLSLIAWGVLFFGAQFFSSAYNVPNFYVQLVSCLFLLSPFRVGYGTLFRVQLQFFHQSLIGLLEELAKLGLILSFFFIFDMGITGILVAIIGSQVISLALLLPSALRSWYRLQGGEDKRKVSLLSLIMGRGVWSISTSYMGNMGKALRLWIIQRVLGTEAVGLYAVAIGLIGHTLALVPLSAVTAPLLAQYAHERKRFIRLLNKTLKYQFFSYACIGVIAFVAFPPVLQFVFPEYAGALPLFSIMLLGLLPTAFLAVMTPAYMALKLQKSLFYSVTLKTTLTVLLTYILASFFGIIGVAYEYVITATIQAFERTRVLKGHVPEMQISRRDLVSFDADDSAIIERSFGFVRRVALFFRKP